MELREDGPHCRAICRDSSAWTLPVEEREHFLDAWQNGRAFFHGLDLYDQPVVIKLAGITGFLSKTEASIALLKAEEEEQRHRKLVAGE